MRDRTDRQQRRRGDTVTRRCAAVQSPERDREAYGKTDEPEKKNRQKSNRRVADRRVPVSQSSSRRLKKIYRLS